MATSRPAQPSKPRTNGFVAMRKHGWTKPAGGCAVLWNQEIELLCGADKGVLLRDFICPLAIMCMSRYHPK
ncbi:hypothetical protein AWB69_03612 [Caballeronia udeis]|uniref:Uncharacterized protein n=1 Tax=Caballeronia udeis TaxID=1232866 RepID=A0A158GYM1_9BURK|nr:hypothetical protein AWB69_03612 [Caballeronia udeis]